MTEMGITEAVNGWQEAGSCGGCLVVVRHGMTAWNVERRLQGRTDIPLNSVGLRQAADVAAALRDLAGIAAVYSSPLSRALQTARVIGESLGLDVQVWSDLTERAYGVLESLTHDEMDRLFPHRRDEGVPGLEPAGMLRQRAVGVMERVVGRHVGEVAVVVSHGALINAFLYVLSGARLGTGVTQLSNGGISVVWRWADSWHLGVVNATTHLSV